MKQLKLWLPALLLSALLTAADAQTRSFVQTETIKTYNVTSDSQIPGLADNEHTTTRVYLDGLGRPLQSIVVKGSPGGKDLIQPIAYDALGRQTTAYLPYAGTTTDGSLHGSWLTEQAAFYSNGAGDKVADDSKPWSTSDIEASPLQRLLKAGTVGDGYQTSQHYKTSAYGLNTSTDAVRIWLPDGSSPGAYSANLLSYTELTDEEGLKVRTFLNASGQTVLKRAISGSDQQDTYYIYDDAGQLIYTLQPKAIKLMQSAGSYSLSVTGVDKLLFKMVYDLQGRLAEKTVPAGGTSYIVYDPLNRPVLTQDARQRASNTWLYIKYDSKGRAISQGTYTDGSHTNLGSMQSYVSGLSYTYYYEDRSTSGTYGYYTNNSFPGSGITPLAYMYYDDYDMNNDGSADLAYQSLSITGELGATAATTGMLTAMRKSTVSNSGSPVWTTSYLFYDKYGHPIQVRGNNHVYATISDVSTTVPDRTGKPILTKVVKYISSGSSTTVQTTYSYDAMDRVTAIDQQYNGGSTVHVATYAYNELGQLVDKKLGVNGSSFLQSVDYRYNIRGQLTSINNSDLSDDHTTTNTNDDSNDLFGMELVYDKAVSGMSNTAYYNQRLSAVMWKSVDASYATTAKRGYNYSYNGYGQLSSAYYQQNSGSGWDSDNFYSEGGITYDAGGNITALNRTVKGSTVAVMADQLTYTYDSANPNQLFKVADASGNNGFGFRNLAGATSSSYYQYDAAGSLTSDPYKGLSIDYNVIGRTDKVTVTTSSGRYINYTYDAGGTLLRKDQYDSGSLQHTTDYIGGFVYLDGTLDYFAAPEGRVRNAGGTLKDEYVIADQQGNARVSFEDNGSGTAVVRQENSYYAFGIVIPNSPVSTPGQPNKNLYNAGSEWQNDYSDLPDYYQTYYRNYDAAIGRFVGVDPMAASADSWTTYQYAYNNPVIFNDPMGDLADYSNHDQGIPRTHNPDQSMADWLYKVTGGLYGRDPSYVDYLINSGQSGAYTAYSTEPGDTGMHYTYDANGNYVSAMPNGFAHDSYSQQVDNPEFLDDGLGNILGINHRSEVQLVYFENAMIPNGSNYANFPIASIYAANMRTSGELNTVITASGVSTGLQSEIIDFGVRTSFKSANTASAFKQLTASQQAWREASVLGNDGSKLLNLTKNLGYVAGAASAAITTTRAAMYYYNGGKGSSVAIKAGLDLVMTGVGFLGPIGFAISAGYFLLDYYTDGFGGYGKIQ